MKNNLRLSILVVVVVCGIYSIESYAQNNQYKRPKPNRQRTESVVGKAKSDTKSDSATATKDSKKEEKVDIKDIENQYWSPKDTEFHVVQNRRYAKDKRFFTSLSFGGTIGDSYTKGNVYSLGIGYFFNEQYGVELMYSQFSIQSSDATNTYRSMGGTAIGLNLPNYFAGAGFVWMPIYAKLSLFEKKIIYFDMAFTPVIGVTSVSQQQLAGVTTAGPYFTYGIDVSQHFYLDEHFAIRADFKTRWYNQTVKPYSGASADINNTQTSQSLNLGVVYWY